MDYPGSGQEYDYRKDKRNDRITIVGGENRRRDSQDMDYPGSGQEYDYGKDKRNDDSIIIIGETVCHFYTWEKFPQDLYYGSLLQKPSDDLIFVRNNFASNELTTLKAQLENLTQEKEQLKSMVTGRECDLKKRESEILTLKGQLENVTLENDLLKQDISENETNLMAQVRNLTQENEHLQSKRQRYRRRIANLLNDLDGFERLKLASQNFLDALYFDDNDDNLDYHFEAFESLFSVRVRTFRQ